MIDPEADEDVVAELPIDVADIQEVTVPPTGNGPLHQDIVVEDVDEKMTMMGGVPPT